MKNIQRIALEKSLKIDIKGVLPKGYKVKIKLLVEGLTSKVKVEGIKDVLLKGKVLKAYSKWLTDTIACCTEQMFPAKSPKFSLEFI